jgi:hypothetical protein
LSVESRVLILPGLFNSGSQHWQTQWELMHPSFRRVNQRDWQAANRAEWVSALHSAVTESSAPAILVAHSLACCLVAHWARDHEGPVRAALLVAPSDVEVPDFPPGTAGFVPMPLARLPFRSIVVASTNDPYVSVARARHFATSWGSRFELAGAHGHLNSESRLGTWPQGFAFLQELATEAAG